MAPLVAFAWFMPYRRLTALLAEYNSLLGEIDSWFTACRTAAPVGMLACRPGCSACCRGLFDISLLDAFLIRQGFCQLSEAVREVVLGRCRLRLAELQRRWPQLQPPFLLNSLPDDGWQEMPEEDETPCPLLAENGLCLVYPFRPMTCRLHGLPNIDRSGEDFSADLCTLHPGDPRRLPPEILQAPFRKLFLREVQLLHRLTGQLTGLPTAEADTFIPLALLVVDDDFR
ncbi:MAG: YkgJ family cysteine cluster protein [Desulfuromonadales bacterium]|nr:YkgJ family cysteine cluster protein [Desulfuromonadales bacterium]